MPPPMGIRGGGGLGGGGSRLGLPSGWRTVYIQTLRNISLFSLYRKPKCGWWAALTQAK